MNPTSSIRSASGALLFITLAAPSHAYLPSPTVALPWGHQGGHPPSAPRPWHPQGGAPTAAPSSRAGLGAAWQHRPVGTRRMSGRDLIDVRGLPKSNIMRTNSTAAYALDFDLSQSVTTSFEQDLVDLNGFMPKALPSPVLASGASVISAAALIAGCMVGAGVLALPSVTVHSGFMPSTAAIAAVWAYCVSSGLLIGEVCINTRGKAAAASYLKIAGATVGRDMANVAFALFTVFQYLLLVAYISQGGALLNNFLSLFGSAAGAGLPHFEGAAAPAAFTLGMGALLTMGNKRLLENVNNVVVTLVLGSFTALLTAGLQKVDPSLLTHADVGKLHDVVPVAMCALVFQNVIPLISASLQFDRSKVQAAILLGSGFPMLMYLAWNAMVIGNTPLESLSDGHAFDLLGVFHGAPEVGLLFAVFSLAAIMTSFIGSTLSVIEEISEFLRGPDPGHVDMREPSAGEKLPLYLVVLVPPLIASIVYPEGFLSAIETSGGFGDPFLFGLLPVIMAWKVRYDSDQQQPANPLASPPEADEKPQPLLPGGKVSLALVALTTVAMFINKSSESVPFLHELVTKHAAAASDAINHAMA